MAGEERFSNGLGAKLKANKLLSCTARTLLLTVIAYFGTAHGAHAATPVSGAINANTTWSLAQSPYEVTADVSVLNGATLTIEAGSVIYFDAATNLTISSGALVARGMAGQPISFTSILDTTGGVPAPGNWGQIRFLSGTNAATTVLEYAQIRFGKGFSVQAASPTFNYLQITNNLGPAISIDLNSSPRGVGNQATGNTLNGISVPAGDMVGIVDWGIKGIPYVVTSGVVSVGTTPAISSISVGTIQQGDSISAILSGSRLSGVQSVSLSNPGVTAIVQSGATDTSVPVQLIAAPVAALGAADIGLQVDAGFPVLVGALQVIQPQPIVTGLSPNPVYASQAGNVLNVMGKNFVPASVVQLDNVDLTTVYASASSLSTTLPVLTAGNKNVTVKQPDPLSAGNYIISKPAVLGVTVPPLALSPASVSQILGVPFNLTVTIPFVAPSGGDTVNLASGTAAIATVPPSVTIVAGATSATIPVTTTGLGITAITASQTGFASASTQVQSNAPPSLSIAANKTVDVAGNIFGLTINSSSVAGAGGLVVALSSSSPTVAAVPASVTIPVGASSIFLQVTGLATGTATITATSNGFVGGGVALTVRPITQSVSVSPLPVAIPPDNVARKITLKLAAVDSIDQVFTVNVSDATVAAVGASSVTIPAGQTSAQLPVTGKKEGTASITLTSPTLGTVIVPVYVTIEYAGINVSYAPLVGVVKISSVPVTPTQIPALVASPGVGVAFGKYISGIAPNLLTIGTGPTIVTINGDGLQNATSVNISPADGLTIGAFTVNPDGKSLSVPVTVAANAATTLRRIVVSGAAGQYSATSVNADRLLISMPLPQVTSVDPLFAVPGNVVTLVVRGSNFQNAMPITVTPPDGISVGSSPTVSADGTQLTTTLSIDALAAHGARVVQVATPAGTSDSVAGPSNTLTLVSQVQNTVTPVASPLVGLVKVTAAVPPPASQTYGLFTPVLGIAKGATVSGVVPAVGAIGNAVTMTITGNELQNVTAVQFNPATGLTVGTPLIAADGKSLTVSVAVDAAAPLGIRSLQVLAGTASLPFSVESAATFKVILPLANITSVESIVMAIPSSSITLALNGSNFQNASEIRISPNADVTLANPPTVSTDGTRATVTVTIAATATAGNRVVSIVTPAGESSLDATVANTVNLTTTPGSPYGPLTSPLVGLVKQTTAAPSAAPQIAALVATPVVGVVLVPAAVAPIPVTMSVFQPSPQVGVLYGTAGFTLAPGGMLTGSSGVLTVTGVGLDAVTGATANPATGITLGALQVSPDGTQLTIPVTTAVDAAVGYRWLVLNRAVGAVSFAQPGANSFWIASALPALDSVTPNLGNQGTTLATFTLRGSNLQNATAVVAEPADGITFGVPGVDATGTVLTVGMVIDANAPTTARVIRVSTHGVMSSGVAAPANTFTVYP